MIKKLFLFILLISCCFSSVFTNEITFPLKSDFSLGLTNFNLENEDNNQIEYKKNWWLPFTEAIASDLLLLGINRFVRNAPYAYITWDSMYENLTNPWVWDQDEFSVNQIGHPYQGSFYFIAGRANNLNYWESYLPTVVGSVFWEIFMETEKPSINDFIVTTFGGAAVGEMLHRLFLESAENNSWTALLLSPMGSLNFAFTGKPSMRLPQKIESLTFGVSLGAVSHFQGINNRIEFQKIDELPLTIGASLGLVYGNPHGHETTTPYSHFELQLQADWSYKYYSVSMFSNGLLWSIAPDWSKNGDTTFGISQHYDFIISEDLWYNANSVGATLKQGFSFDNDVSLRYALHLNYILLGSSEYFYFISGEIGKPESGEERRDYDISIGENVKFYLSVGSEKIGTFSMWGIFNGLHTLPGTVPESGSPGFTIITLAGFSYEHILGSDKYLLGLSNSLYHKAGFYDNADNITTLNNYSSIYFKIKFR